MQFVYVYCIFNLDSIHIYFAGKQAEKLDVSCTCSNGVRWVTRPILIVWGFLKGVSLFPQSLLSKGWMWCEYHLTPLTCMWPQRHTGFAGGLWSDGSETLSFHSVNEENGPPFHRPFNSVESCWIKNAQWIMKTINPNSPKYTHRR